VSPTAAELGRTLAAAGDVAGARSVLEDPASRSAEDLPWAAAALLGAEAAASLAEGDREAGLGKSLAALQRLSVEPVALNPRAAAVWWAGSLFGSAEVGGDEAIEDVRETLERNGWRQALREPVLLGSAG
jgi:hypothetical protein